MQTAQQTYPAAQPAAAPAPRLAVIIPCHRVRESILDVIGRIGPEVSAIYVVDDRCPEQTGQFVEANRIDPRVRVLYNGKNLGVGGATLAGYRGAIADGMDLLIKIDGDGQMDPSLIPCFAAPILAGKADYTKGNRFFHLEHLRGMPGRRAAGNAILSLMTKVSTGYWTTIDPTNGFTCIHARIANALPLHKISARYFFESDMLFRLGTLGAVVHDVPMASVYGSETSGLKITKIIPEFLFKHGRNWLKRLFYSYILRDFNAATVESILGSGLLLGGFGFGVYRWALSAESQVVASSGTVMLAAMPMLLGFQLLLSAVNYDIQSTPINPLHPRLQALQPRPLPRTALN
jgi:dolichol-phosphate mannosyltransferase